MEFSRKQKEFHENPSKLLFSSKQYAILIKKYGPPDLSDLLNQINYDIIREILIYLDNKTLTSLLLIIKHTCQLLPLYQDNIFKYALQRELDKTKMNFSIGTRISDGKHNYKITSIKNNNATVVRVDLLGYIVNNKFYCLSARHNKTSKKYVWYMGKSEITNDIVLCKNGPIIKSVDSKYLKYQSDEAKIGVTALIKYEQYKGLVFHNECVIKEINDNKMILDCQNHILIATYIDNKWICDKDINIIKFANS